MDRIELIAEKRLGYNRDIDQHIISCRISRELLYQKDLEILQVREQMDNIRNTLQIKEEEIRQKEAEIRVLLEEKLRIENQKDREIKQYKDIIKECYFEIDKLTFG